MWGILGLTLNLLPLSAVAIALLVVYSAWFGLLEVNGIARPAPPGTSWQVPAAWVVNVGTRRRFLVWGAILGPGFATRNPYAGFAALPIVVAAVGNVPYGLALAVALGVAHSTGRALALLRDAHRIDVANYLDSVLKSMYWRMIDGYALFMIGGAAIFACLQRFG